MRYGIIVVAVVVSVGITDRALAVGRVPGGTLKWLGWGYSAGHHAPIAHAHPPLRGAILHAPGVYWLHPHFGPSHLHPSMVGPYAPYVPYDAHPGDVGPYYPVEPLPPANADSVLPPGDAEPLLENGAPPRPSPDISTRGAAPEQDSPLSRATRIFIGS